MKNLVIAVSPDSSLDLLGTYAEICILDKNPIFKIDVAYDTVYIRSHFSQPSTLPQVFRSEIDTLIKHAKSINPHVKFVDGMDTVDKILAFEDKWSQYKIFGHFMVQTELYTGQDEESQFVNPIYKKRLSSRGNGVTWNKERVIGATNEWIKQESLDIYEELRIYIIKGEVYPIGAIKQTMTEGQKAEALDSRRLLQDEMDFSRQIIAAMPSLDIVGIDVARTNEGKLKLLEANRSPGFAKFYELTSINLASILYLGLNRGSKS